MDIVIIYSSIDTDKGLTALFLCYKTNLLNYSLNLLNKHLIKALKSLIRYNIFKFGLTYYR